MSEMESGCLPEFTAHEQHILASDHALAEAARLVASRTPLPEWPNHLRIAVSMALAQACDDTRLAKNRVSAHRANELIRFLSRRGVVHSTSFKVDLESASEQSSFVDSEYIMDRLLADLVTKASGLIYQNGKIQ